MRRAGFGATFDELDELVQVPYEQLVDDLLHPERFPEVDDTLLRRYYLELNNPDTHGTWQAHWIYRMVNTQAAIAGEDRPLLASRLRHVNRQE